MKAPVLDGTLRLRLYVAGNSPNSVRAIANARLICAEHFATTHVLEIVDMISDSGRGMADGIIVTPTLLKLAPSPTHRIVGNLDDTASVLRILSTP